MTKLLSMLALFVFIMSVGSQVAQASGYEDDSTESTSSKTSDDVMDGEDEKEVTEPETSMEVDEELDE